MRQNCQQAAKFEVTQPKKMLQLHAMFYFCEQFDGNIRCDIGPFPNIKIISTDFNRDKGEISNLCWFLL